MCQIDHKVPVYIFVVFYEGRVCFCVGAQLSEQTFPRSWVARELQPGDLSRLTDFALFRNRRPASVVVDRLCERGFMARTKRGRRRMILKGWMAIRLRKTLARKNELSHLALKSAIANSRVAE